MATQDCTIVNKDDKYFSISTSINRGKIIIAREDGELMETDEAKFYEVIHDFYGKEF